MGDIFPGVWGVRWSDRGGGGYADGLYRVQLPNGLHHGSAVGQLQRVRHASGLRAADQDLSGGLLHTLRQVEEQVKKKPVSSIFF